MSCFEMVEKRQVTSGRLNLGDLEVVSYKVRIDHQTRDSHPSRWSTCFQEAISWQVYSFEDIWVKGDRVMG